MMEAFVCDSVRTPIGRFGGALSTVRPDDLAAHVVASLIERNAGVDWDATDDVILGAANQAGEDNRNVARMALLLAGMAVDVPGVTVNRLCGSGMESIGLAARAIKTGEADLIVAGGAESMSRAPKVMPKPEAPFSRSTEMYDTTIGWRFVNPAMEARFGRDEMYQTAENLAREMEIAREDQDRFALRSHERAIDAIKAGRLAEEIVAFEVPRRRGDPVLVDTDEHPRPGTTLERFGALRTIVSDGTVTAGNASGINDGAAALIIASERAVERYGLDPQARIIGMAAAGVPPRIMGIGPVPATRKLLDRTGVSLADVDVIELNEAFASQSLACLRELGLPDDAAHVNPNGGAIALGHPLGMSGARLVTTATRHLVREDGELALTTMCIGVGQGIAMLLTKV
ncbi:MAG: 3-oxoadipyl-CoA thiolase [Acidimicrobiia bacterium]